MKTKSDRIKTLKRLISSRQMGSQDEVLAALAREGYVVTQATLSRDLKQLKVAKTADRDGKYMYVLPNETAYRRVQSPSVAAPMPQASGYRSITFSGNIGVMRTDPGYASAIAGKIDIAGIPYILGTVAGDDTIIIVLQEGALPDNVVRSLSAVVPGM